MNGADVAAWLAVYAPRTLRAGRSVATTRTLPIWLRVLYILGVQVWCPLPIDEAFLILAILATLCVPAYRAALAAAWRGAVLPVTA
jgi:hypothetical protein